MCITLVKKENLAKFQCFFCRYADINNLDSSTRISAYALDLPEYSEPRIIEADSADQAMTIFQSEYIEDSDFLHLKYPQCITVE